MYFDYCFSTTAENPLNNEVIGRNLSLYSSGIAAVKKKKKQLPMFGSIYLTPKNAATEYMPS